MTRVEAVQTAIQEAKEEQEEGLEWSEEVRQRWIGYVAALSQVGVLTSSEFFMILRESLDVEGNESEYALYLHEVNLPGASDLVDLKRVEA